MRVCFQIQRQAGNAFPRVEQYEIEAAPSTTILDCLNQIKWQQDGSLAFRKNCRNTICGSCAMRVNDRPALACKETLQDEFNRSSQSLQLGDGKLGSAEVPVIQIQPLQNFPVIKDLVVEMGEFWQNLAQITPYVEPATPATPGQEFTQLPAERAKVSQVSNCILCGACYSDCNAKATVPEFVGPHALAKAYRMLADTRDGMTAERLEQYTQDLSGVWGCTRCFNCNTVCPVEVAPLDQITRIKAQRLSQSANADDERAVRHRRAMIDLVAQGGWIDERRFGLAVVGNHFRDLKGLWSLVPLGLRMMRHGKFPTSFEPSTGNQTVRELVRSIRLQELTSVEDSIMPSPAPTPAKSNTNDLSEDVNKSSAPINEATAEKKNAPATPKPLFGWTAYAEQMNGRFAMLGLVLLLLLEWVTKQDFITWLGLR
jgi:succinate dehydrogenase / fumarate reductase, iron-sulfur subunit